MPCPYIHHLDGMFVRDPAESANHLHAVRVQQPLDPLPEGPHHLIFAPLKRGQIHLNHAVHDPQLFIHRQLVQEFRGSKQHLRGYAPHVQAGAAQLVLLHDADV